MMRKKCLIWDFGNTLGHRENGMSGALLEAVQEVDPTSELTLETVRPFFPRGLPWDRPDEPHLHLKTAQQFWDSLDSVFERAFAEMGFDPDPAQRMAHSMRRIFPNPQRFRLFDDTLPALQALSQRGWTHIILSNHVPELPQIVSALGLDAYISEVFTSATIGYEKPHPEAFCCVLKKTGPAWDFWMIGDSLKADIEGAEAEGIPGVLVRNHSTKAKYNVDTLTDLVDLLEEIAGS